jgi:UDP-2,3-diacylglucosamine pyrophosphatase LpxH
MDKYKSVFISDIHLGSRGCKAHELTNFLKSFECEQLYLVGDIIDGWKMQQNKMHWKQSHTNVIRSILNKAKNGTKVVYIVGNHDEFLRPLLRYSANFGRVEILNQATHLGVNGKRYLVVHGDMFDGITRLAPWISFLGDRAYDFLLNVNSKYNYIRHKLGFGYWSLSRWLKHRVKKAIDFMFEYEKNITAYALKRGYDGVICGHIHNASIHTVNEVEYMNDGDWVESLTALIEHLDGTWTIHYHAGNSIGQHG